MNSQSPPGKNLHNTLRNVAGIYPLFSRKMDQTIDLKIRSLSWKLCEEKSDEKCCRMEKFEVSNKKLVNSYESNWVLMCDSGWLSG